MVECTCETDGFCWACRGDTPTEQLRFVLNVGAKWLAVVWWLAIIAAWVGVWWVWSG